jgi:ADP-heptose:LPS heptosyltransferase
MRLLWIQPGAIGDFIVALPGMTWVKQNLKPEWFEVWAERVNLSLAQAPGYADHAKALADTGIDRYPLPERLFERLNDFDQVLSWWGAGAAVVVHRHPSSYFLKALPPGSSFHVLDFKRSQLETLFGSPLTDFPPYPEIHWTSEDIQFARQVLGSGLKQAIAVIHPGASGKAKQWPAANFAALAVRLAVEKRMEVLLAEGPLDRSVRDEVVCYVAASNAKVNLKWLRVDNLRRLSAVLGLCDLYVGNDSGITHLAAASGTRTLAIFTVTDPNMWAPRGPNVIVCVNPTVDEAWAALTRLPEKPAISAN